MEKVVLEKAAIEGTSAGALATVAVSPFLPPDKAAAVGAFVMLASGLWKAYRSNKNLRRAKRQRRRASDAVQ